MISLLGDDTYVIIIKLVLSTYQNCFFVHGCTLSFFSHLCLVKVYVYIVVVLTALTLVEDRLDKLARVRVNSSHSYQQ